MAPATLHACALISADNSNTSTCPSSPTPFHLHQALFEGIRIGRRAPSLWRRLGRLVAGHCLAGTASRQRPQCCCCQRAVPRSLEHAHRRLSSNKGTWDSGPGGTKDCCQREHNRQHQPCAAKVVPWRFAVPTNDMAGSKSRSTRRPRPERKPSAFLNLTPASGRGRTNRRPNQTSDSASTCGGPSGTTRGRHRPPLLLAGGATAAATTTPSDAPP